MQSFTVMKTDIENQMQVLVQKFEIFDVVREEFALLSKSFNTIKYKIDMKVNTDHFEKCFEKLRTDCKNTI